MKTRTFIMAYLVVSLLGCTHERYNVEGDPSVVPIAKHPNNTSSFDTVQHLTNDKNSVILPDSISLVEELKDDTFFHKIDTIPQMSTTLLSQELVMEYERALMLFYEQKYQEAFDTLAQLLCSPIDEDFIDHCQYWMGECCFAQQRYVEAESWFEKNINSDVSRKKEDAYIMLGQIYEKLDDDLKAEHAYQIILTYYPESRHLALAQKRIQYLHHKFDK
jgi:TolA-binding protein